MRRFKLFENGRKFFNVWILFKFRFVFFIIISIIEWYEVIIKIFVKIVGIFFLV